jgi:hypothetical protein
MAASPRSIKAFDPARSATTHISARRAATERILPPYHKMGADNLNPVEVTEMVGREVVALFLAHLPDREIRSLRDSIAKAEAELGAPMWERHRELHGRIMELKDKCVQAGHALLAIVLAGNPGTRRRLMRNGRNERRTCIICGAEEGGKLTTGFLRRFLSRKAVWKFQKLNRQSARTFTDTEWYLETSSIVGNLSFSTDVVLQHAFPPRVYFSG